MDIAYLLEEIHSKCSFFSEDIESAKSAIANFGNKLGFKGIMNHKIEIYLGRTVEFDVVWLNRNGVELVVEFSKSLSPHKTIELDSSKTNIGIIVCSEMKEKEKFQEVLRLSGRALKKIYALFIPPTDEVVWLNFNDFLISKNLEKGAYIYKFPKKVWKGFPYKEIRSGQIEFLNDVFCSIELGEHLIAHAPTGIGKTAASILPGLQFSLQNNKVLVFLTSKQSQHRIAVETVKELAKAMDRKIRAVDIISKQSMCPKLWARTKYSLFHEFCKLETKMKKCKFFLKNNSSVVKKILDEIMHVEDVKKICIKAHICPHKAVMDACRNADIIICDYNYIFSKISEIFLNKLGKNMEEIVIIVDEAHNLPDRIREEESDFINKSIIAQGIKDAKDGLLRHNLKLLLSVFESLTSEERELKKEELLIKIEEKFKESLMPITYSDFMTRLSEEVNENPSESLMRIADFLNNWIAGREGYLYYSKALPTQMLLYKLLDPSIYSEKIFKKVNSSVLMSGTLYPPKIYGELLGLEKNRTVAKDYASPFPKENRLILALKNVTTLYDKRSEMHEKIGKNINAIANSIKKNVAVFFPSYELMGNVLPYVSIKNKVIISEKREMLKEEKVELLSKLVNAKKENGAMLIGVLGGSFSEGIDYKDNLLDCVIIVGLPLLPPSLEIKAMIKYYDKKFGSGIYYAYFYPSMNKVIQASGRMIRSETDRGIIVLMDARYSERRFRITLPKDFEIVECNEIEEAIKMIDEFFSNYKA
ncbi:MAG: ATP-dependent DNA helicase [Candidatus Thermoplasmatota archaeon]